jgi:hypothetical protein
VVSLSFDSRSLKNSSLVISVVTKQSFKSVLLSSSMCFIVFVVSLIIDL